MAVSTKQDWSAKMIVSAKPVPLNEDGSARPLRFWKAFTLPPQSRVLTADLYATAHGVYQANINGRQVGDHCMAPGWQSYHKRLHYQVFDVTHLLKHDEPNLIEIDVGPGWYASALTTAMRRFNYGSELGILAQIELVLEADAKPYIIATDSEAGWHCCLSKTLSSEIYAGETYDTRFDQSSSFDVTLSSSILPPLISPKAPPVRVTEVLTPVKLFKSKSGKPIADFGQNMAGRIRIKDVQKPTGTRIVFRHAEILENGELGTRQLRGAAATDTLICDGSLILNWHPKFTFHGFRYVEVAEGWSPEDEISPLTFASIVAEVIHCDMRRTGWFSCSNEEVNRLHENAVWSMRSNFLSIPSDDPQRDERLGWTGDLNMFCATANFLYDTTGMLSNWLEDLAADQMDDSPEWRKGVLPLIVPNCTKKRPGDGPGWSKGWGPLPMGVWSDAAVMVPWQLCLTSGDKTILERQYASMVAYLDKGVDRGLDGLWAAETWQFGDWLDPLAPINDSGRGLTDGTFVADCYLLKSTSLMATISSILNQPENASKYQQTYDDLLSTFRHKYLTPSGLLAPDSPTAYALALAFNLMPAHLHDAAASRLIRCLRLNDFRIPTGFVGTAHLLPALSLTGNSNIAYAMLLATGYPSILYPVRMGATTIWERWDALKPNGKVNEGSMTSFNHYALGSVVGWLYTCCAGIKLLPPGNGEEGEEGMAFEIKPEVHHCLSRVEARFDSRVGMVEVRWRIEGVGEERKVKLDVVVLGKGKARIVLPREAIGVERAGEDGTWFSSGEHHFEWKYVQQGDWPVKPLLPPWGRAEY